VTKRQQTDPPPSPPRLSAADRRSATLSAAAAVFARKGYHGASTERIAQAAGISQPYVVRMFGSKERLFVSLIDDCVERVLEAFRAASASEPETAGAAAGDEPPSLAARLGAAYSELATEDGVHLIIMQAYMLGADPVIGPRARDGFTRIVGYLTGEAGLTVDETERFLARGMLINTLLGLRMQEGDDPAVTEILRRASLA
jgi:TetR/AcrR family transcriptional regulator